MAATKSRIVSPVRTFDQNGREKLPHKVVRDLLEIKNPDKYKANVAALGLSQHKSLYWEDVKRLLALRLFIADNYGGNSIQMFVYMESESLIGQYFAEREIDLEARFKRLKDKYEARFPMTGITRHYSEVSEYGGSSKSVKPQKPITVTV